MAEMPVKNLQALCSCLQSTVQALPVCSKELQVNYIWQVDHLMNQMQLKLWSATYNVASSRCRKFVPAA